MPVMRHPGDIRHELSVLRDRAERGSWSEFDETMCGLDREDALLLCELAESLLEEVERCRRLLEDVKRRTDPHAGSALSPTRSRT